VIVSGVLLVLRLGCINICISRKDLIRRRAVILRSTTGVGELRQQ
jgi:hypothetical protein